MSKNGRAAQAQERPEDRRSFLIAKSAELMAAKGYHQTTMRDVSRATGYSLAGVYHYFTGKEDLLFQMQRRVFSSLLEEQLAVREETSPGRERLEALIQTHLSFFGRHAAELKVCTFELQSLQGEAYREIEALRRRYFKLIVEEVTALLAEGGQQPCPETVRYQVLFIFGALNWTFMWFDAARDAPVEQLGDELCRLVFEGLDSQASKDLACPPGGKAP